MVEWSWDLLSAEERLLAERLAVFPACADSAGATVICASHDAALLARMGRVIEIGAPAGVATTERAA